MNQNDLFNLTGSVAVVTGCNGGHGLEAARALMAQGAVVIAIARRPKKLQAVTGILSEEFGRPVPSFVCDLTSTDMIRSTVANIMMKYGRIDILVNNAGVGEVTPAEEVTDEQFGNELNHDLFGAFRMSREVANEAMIPARYGRIINLCSIYGLVGNKIAGSAPYHAAKGGIVSMTRALAAEWGKYGITVNAICPGFFENALMRETMNTEDFVAYSKMVIPLERYGKTEELDAPVVFLASPGSSYVTGSVIPVDGGYTSI